MITPDMEKEAESLLRMISPTTVWERQETVSVLGEELSFSLLGIVPKVDEPSYSDVEIAEEEPEPEKTRYKRQTRLEAFLKAVRKEERNMVDTIKFCFGDLFLLFDAQFNTNRQNFLSYGYFVNRILELHGRHKLKDRLNIKEPKTVRVQRNNRKLWCMYLKHLEKNLGYSIGQENGRH